MSDYSDFLAKKAHIDLHAGFDMNDLLSFLFPHQDALVRWALKKGRAAIFADTGLGKTAMQLCWAKEVSKHTGGDVLVVAPLCVSHQTVKEGRKFDIPLQFYSIHPSGTVGAGVTNYEKLQHFHMDRYAGVVLDESSILKNQTGKMRTALIESCASIPYRLSCTATPSPNDYMELGNQAEWLGVMSTVEMLAMFFTHDGGETSKWRLKGHGKTKFWEWLASWAAVIRKPSDLGFPDDGYDLPPLEFFEHIVDVDHDASEAGTLFPMEAVGLLDRGRARKSSIDDRVRKCAELVNSSDDGWIIWCNMNEESEKLTAAIDGAVEVTGSMSDDRKERAIMGFTNGEIKRLITKPSIAGFGMNWQHVHNMAFVGLSDSYEQFYQAVRRCWRFGQQHQVNAHIIIAETEGAVLANIKRKEQRDKEMAENMVEHMRNFTQREVLGMKREKADYKEDHKTGDQWEMFNGDCIDVVSKIDNDSIGYSIFSPPFASLYTYSNSDRDMGNSSGDEQFADHFRYLVDELYRVTMPGRLVSFHCMNLPTSKVRDGFIGIKDFRGEMIRIFQDAGFIFASEVCIWKDPVTAMQRTKALGLLHKTIRKDSSMSRQGIPDYVVTMRKPGDNQVPIPHGEDLPVSLWQKYASPIWTDINPSNTLNAKGSKDDDDERHICPLQLDVIERCIHLWSAPGDRVLSPFAGIGSEGYVSVKMNRRFIGIELKPSYFKVACKNMKIAQRDQMPLLAVGES